MAVPDTIIVDGHAFNWRRVCELRRQQIEAWRTDAARQVALFELRHDCRPPAARTAAQRYQEPSLFDGIRGDV